MWVDKAVREASMRLLILSLVVSTAAIFAETQPLSAQSPSSYPWCARQAGKDFDTTSCYFTSYQQCMTTVSGIGGYCNRSPGSQAYGGDYGRRGRSWQY